MRRWCCPTFFWDVSYTASSSVLKGYNDIVKTTTGRELEMLWRHNQVLANVRWLPIPLELTSALLFKIILYCQGLQFGIEGPIWKDIDPANARFKSGIAGNLTLLAKIRTASVMVGLKCHRFGHDGSRTAKQ
ncbi:hypothetical protein O3M35_012415 [Rhynocoris fuscipes]|uniref:Uncharacterized protein n=1 Tax=Rhynocoris fuscipes TaxID=488301 RepID=A0AAW1CTX1_9HEMI